MNQPEINPAEAAAATQRARILMTTAMLNAGGEHDVALGTLLTAYFSLLMQHPCCYAGGLRAMAMAMAAVQGAQALQEGAASAAGDTSPDPTANPNPTTRH